MATVIVLRMIGKLFLSLGLYEAAQELHSYGLGIATAAMFVLLVTDLIKGEIGRREN